MKLLALGALALFATALTGAALTHDWNSEDDETLVQTVAAAALNQDDSNIHRVTEVTFKMADPTAALCRARGAPLHNPHVDYYCHVYVNDLALQPMETGNGTYPEGSLVIKQKFSDQRGIDTELFTVMRKMHDGYDKENGNWEYSIVDASAQTVMSRGRTDSCINCHTDYAGTDYVTRLYMKTKRD